MTFRKTLFVQVLIASATMNLLVSVVNGCGSCSSRRKRKPLQVRLVGGPFPHAGRVELGDGSIWGTVCDDSWDINDARVICRMLSFPGATAAHGSAFYGRGTGKRIFLDDVHCKGTEDSIMDCKHNGWAKHNCDHSEDASVVCMPKAVGCRLVGGTDITNGRVELYYKNKWWTVCDDDWDINDAKVICRMLGFSGATRAYSSAHFGQGSGSIALDDVECKGYEKSITACRNGGWEIHNCSPSEDAGVACFK